MCQSNKVTLSKGAKMIKQDRYEKKIKKRNL